MKILFRSNCSLRSLEKPITNKRFVFVQAASRYSSCKFDSLILIFFFKFRFELLKIDIFSFGKKSNNWIIYAHNCDGRSLIQTIFIQYLGYILVNLTPGFYMDIFYRLSSLFALESFLSSQCTDGNTVLREVSVFLGICLFL